MESGKDAGHKHPVLVPPLEGLQSFSAEYLAYAGQSLGSSLDCSQTLQSLAQLVVPHIADCCLVDVAEDGDASRHVAVTHVDSKKERTAREWLEALPITMRAPYGIAATSDTAAELVVEVTQEWLSSNSASPCADLLSALGARSLIIAPLATGSRPLGALSCVFTDSGRRYSSDDVRLVRELARRAARAVEHALLYGAAQAEIERRKRAEQDLRFRAYLLDSVGEAVLATDAHDRIVYANRCAQTLLRCQTQFLMGRNWMDVIPAEPARAAALEALSRAKEGQTWSGEMAAKRCDGSRFEASITHTPVFDERGCVTGRVCVCTDLTDRKRWEDELIRMQKLESIGLLAGGIAHDFNNVLTAIVGNMALAKMDVKEGSAAYQALVAAEKSFLRARELTQQLITFARGGAPIKRTAPLGDTLVNAVQLALAGANVRAEMRIDDDLWMASFDAGQINQAITNIVNNAREAMPAGGTVRLSACNQAVNDGDVPGLPAGRYTRVDIADHGVGIPREHLSRIFDPYFSTKQKGGGLGLATAYSIVQKHDGGIQVESEAGHGSRFSIYLPAATIATNSPSPEPGAKNAGRILVMDDEADIRKVSGALLEALGYEPEFAANGEEAADLYRQALEAGQPFGAVILDLTIPEGMGGVECLEVLKRLDPNVRALVSSGYSSDPVMAEYLKYGFVGRIPKPYQLNELSQALREVLAVKND